MLRDICAALGAVTLAGFFLLVAIVLVGSVLGGYDRGVQRRRRWPVHDCREREMIFAEASAYLEYRCTICGRPRVIGGVRCTASNRRTRRSA